MMFVLHMSRASEVAVSEVATGPDDGGTAVVEDDAALTVGHS